MPATLQGQVCHIPQEKVSSHRESQVANIDYYAHYNIAKDVSKK